MEYVVIFEKGENSYGASVPDLPGCIAVAETMAEVRELIAEAIEFHIQGLREDGEIVPQPSSILFPQSEPGVSSALIAVSV
ncbi:MAG: type II toxin-antitoxin system HicB family antitoxin [Candidatus Poribacteria bacterium]|nr:type II toxin-antitoxin system HicB family antitoxin [Candidatus Poribacteria bacterium]